MSTIGNYQLLDEFAVTAHGSVSRARSVDGKPGVFAVKRFSVAADDPTEPHWELQTFLDRARVQQTLVIGGARHWTPIYDLGIDVDTAWYVTDYIPLTAKGLIDGRAPIKAAALDGIILGVLQALSELKSLRGRPHGNLTPSNVLISGEHLVGAKVLLTDPATNGQAAKVGESGDMRALGELIHLLVTRRPAPTGETRAFPSADWNGLGRKGLGWRKLCVDLLGAEPSARIGLAAVAQRVYALRSRNKRRLGKVLVAAIIVGMLGATAVAVLSALDHSARVQFRQASHNWFGRFVAAASDPIRRKHWNADPDLARILSEVPIDEVKRIDLDADRVIRWKFNDLRDVQNANQIVATVQTELPANWKQASRTAELEKRFEARGWTQPAEYLTELVQGVTPGPGVDVGAGIDRLLNASGSVQSGMKLADADWKQFNDRLATVETMHDPVLTALASALRKSASSDVRLSDAGFTGMTQMKQDGDLASQLVQAIHDTWPTNVDRDAFDKEVARAIDVKNAAPQDATKWLALVQYHALRHVEATAEADRLRKRLKETVELIDRAHIAGDEANSYHAAALQAGLAVAEFEQTPFTRRTLDDGAFAHKRDEVRNRIESLRRFYHPEGPEQWLAALPNISTGSNRINQYWATWKKVLADGMPQMTRDHTVFANRQQASEQMRALLVSLDQGYPPAPPILNEAFMAAARERREQSIEKILPLIDLRDPKLDPEALKASTAEFEHWTTDLVALSKDFPLAKELLNFADHPDEQWKTKQPVFWADPAVQSLVKDDVARLGRITALRDASRDDLVKALAGGGAAEVSLEAWRLLGADAVKPPWPAGNDELAAEFKFRQRLRNSLANLKDPSEADAPLRDLNEQAPIRWRRFVENASSEDNLKSAWNLREAFSIDEKQTALLTPRARYNIDLQVLHQSLTGGVDADVRTALKNLAVDAAAVKSVPSAIALPGRIALVDAPEAFAEQATGEIFGLTLPGQNQPIQFKRVEAGDGRPFYLCTVDVSVGQFVGVVGATKSWQQMRYLPWPYELGKPDTRRGPRTWEWGGSIESPMTTPLLWFAPEEYNDFPPGFRDKRFNRMSLSDAVGGNPTGDHPMQYLSAQAAIYYAALCGCRLPTAAEWQAAYAQYGKSVPPERWNLRDQAWETQRRYVAAGGGSRWPDEGCFTGASAQAAAGRLATSRPQNDGILFFQSVNGSGATVFHHLAGNVAQYVCDASEAFDRLPEKKTLGAIREFLRTAPQSFSVIGGSALSPPEMPVDKPQPVTRTDEGYADVGLRLAFTAPSRSLAEKVKWAIGSPPFIWPKQQQSASR